MAALSTTLPSIAIKKLIPIIETQMMQIFDITSYIDNSINSLPAGVICNDPRVNDIKQQLQNVKQLNTNIQTIKKTMATLSSSFKTVYSVAIGIELIQLAIPAVPGVPQGPFAKLAEIARALGNNCKSASKCLSGLLSTMDSALASLETVVANAIITLTTICIDETFTVTTNVQNEIIKFTEQSNSSNNAAGGAVGTGGSGTGTNLLDSNKGEFNGYSSKFYNEYNVSDDDLNELENIIFDLNDLQLKITDYLQEAPSKVFSGNMQPDPSLGNIGDFYIDLFNRNIFGPKTSDDKWNDTPVKY
jgi:hypothetical protein